MPFIVKGPGIEAGAFSDTPVIGWDLLPTIGALAGYDKPMPKDVDGGSFKNILDSSGNGKVNRPNDYFVFHRYSKGDPYSALREGKYKLVKFWKSKKIFLFDLEKDIEERIDLSKKMPQKTKELEEKLTNYLRLVDSKILKQI